jgi:hypothetical protein
MAAKAARSEEQVRQELETERERLGDAVVTLRHQVERVKRKLPLIAAGAVAVGVTLYLAKRRFSKRKVEEEESRAGLSFLFRD